MSPFEILAITFTNKAAGEMKERVGVARRPGRAPHVGVDVPLRVRADPAARGRAARLPLVVLDLRPGRRDPPRGLRPPRHEPRPEAVPAPPAAGRDLRDEERAHRPGAGARRRHHPGREAARRHLRRVPEAPRRRVRGRLRRPAPARRPPVPRAPRRARRAGATASATSSSTSSRTRTWPSGSSSACSPRSTATSWSSATPTSASCRARSVTMADRTTRPIEQVVAGDQVLSNYGSGDFRPARVLRVHRSRAVEGTKITLGERPRARLHPRAHPLRRLPRRFRRDYPRPGAALDAAPERAGAAVATLTPDAAHGRDVVRRAARRARVPSGRAVRQRRGGPQRSSRRSSGSSIRPERRDTDWRFETASADMAEIAETVEQIRAVLDVDVEYTARLAATARRQRDQHRPAVHRRVGGRARHGDGRTRTGRSSVVERSSRSSSTPRSTTSTSSRPTTSSPAASSPTTRVYALPRGGLPEPDAVRGGVPGGVGDRARPELPVDAAHPRRRQRGHRQQRGPPAEAPVDRADRWRAHRPLPRRGRARRGRVRRARDQPARRPRRACASATPRSSTGPTRRAASSKRRWCAPACRTGSSAARSSTTGAR